MTTAACERLGWDSEFFGISVGRVTVPRLTPELVEAIADWVRCERIDCLYFLCDPTCLRSSPLAERAGFRLTDVRVTLKLGVAPHVAPHPAVRLAIPGDADALATIARVSHTDSRFYFDGHFPVERCDALYEAWIRRSLAGWAAAVFVAEDHGRPAGYVTCHRDDRGGGSIGLIGVAQSAQGSGLGMQLVSAACAWMAEHCISPVTVATQGRNVRAQRLYQRAGFVTADVGLWFHRWSAPPGVA